MATKICTSIEQSKKLLELGIDAKTADMCWQNNEFPIGFNDEDAVPAWSLSALLDVLPVGAESHKQSDGSISYYYVEVYNNKKYFSTKRYDNPIDACYEMIVKLKERKLL